MTDLAKALDLVRSVYSEIGAAEFARLSGVPYTTIVDSAARDFCPKPVAILQKLVDAATLKRAASDAETPVPSPDTPDAVQHNTPANGAPQDESKKGVRNAETPQTGEAA